MENGNLSHILMSLAAWSVLCWAFGHLPLFARHFNCLMFSSEQRSVDRSLLLVHLTSPQLPVVQQSGQMLKLSFLHGPEPPVPQALLTALDTVLMQIFPKIDFQSNIQNSQKNNNLHIILNACRIYVSGRHCSSSFYFERLGKWKKITKGKCASDS